MKFFYLYYDYYYYDYYGISKPELDVEKTIGFYSSYDKCLDALIRCKNKIEFSQHPECLKIDTMILDDDKYWMDGFVWEWDDE